MEAYKPLLLISVASKLSAGDGSRGKFCIARASVSEYPTELPSLLITKHHHGC